MRDSSVHASGQMPRAQHSTKLNAIIAAIGCLGILAIAAYLTPDPRGFGTHEQLGLPPCISSNFLGVPCPLCGMTTSFALMAHARPADAFTAQPAGAIFFVLCVLTLAGTATVAILGYAPQHVAALVRGRRLGIMIIALLLGAWLYKLFALWR